MACLCCAGNAQSSDPFFRLRNLVLWSVFTLVAMGSMLFDLWISPQATQSGPQQAGVYLEMAYQTVLPKEVQDFRHPYLFVIAALVRACVCAYACVCVCVCVCVYMCVFDVLVVFEYCC